MTATGGDFAYDVAGTIAPPEQSFLFSLLDVGMNASETDPNPYGSPKSTEDFSPGATESEYLALLVAIVVTFLILFVLYLLTPGIGLLATMVLVPAIVRWFLCLRRKTIAEGRSAPLGQQFSLFLISVLVMVPVLVATVITFCAVCWAGATIAINIFPEKKPYEGIGTMLLGGVPAGLLAALAVLCFVVWLTIYPPLPGQTKPTTEQPSENEPAPLKDFVSDDNPSHDD